MDKEFRVEILGIEVSNLTGKEVEKEAKKLINGGGFHLMVTLNPEILMLARKDEEFWKIVNQKAAIVTADGIGIVWAGKLLGKSLKERITGNDLIAPLVQLCWQKKWPVMLMGGRPEVAQKALRNLRSKYPNLLVSATTHPLKPLQLIKEVNFLANLIKKEKPAIVFVAMDFGEREKFVLQLIEVLKKKDFRRGTVFVGIGGAIDYLAGTTKRAPKIVQKAGFEWFWRLITEPKKRFFRQVKSLPLFVFLIFKEKFFGKKLADKVR